MRVVLKRGRQFVIATLNINNNLLNQKLDGPTIAGYLQTAQLRLTNERAHDPHAGLSQTYAQRGEVKKMD